MCAEEVKRNIPTAQNGHQVNINQITLAYGSNIRMFKTALLLEAITAAFWKILHCGTLCLNFLRVRRWVSRLQRSVVAEVAQEMCGG